MEVNRTCISFTIFSYVSSLIVTTSAFVKKGRSKMRHLKRFLKPMEIKLRSKMSHWPRIPHRYDDFHKKFFDSILIFLPRSAFLAISSLSSPAPSCSFANSCLRFRKALLYLKYQIRKINTFFRIQFNCAVKLSNKNIISTLVSKMQFCITNVKNIDCKQCGPSMTS